MTEGKGKMFDILGFYFDSQEPNLAKVVEKLNFSITCQVSGVSSHGSCDVNWKFHLSQDGKAHNTPSTDLMLASNQLVPHFVLINDYGGRVYDNSKELFDVKVLYKGKAIMEYQKQRDFGSNSNITIAKAIANVIQLEQIIPLTIQFDFEVVRHTDMPTRIDYLARKRGGKDPEKYFANACNPEFVQSTIGGDHLSSYYRRRDAFRGDVKKAIFSLGYKDTCVMAIEYLYGVKFPKNLSYRQLFDKFASQPYNDFGVRDVQVMQKLLKVLEDRYADKSKLYAALVNSGVKCASKMVRWQKHIQPKPTATITDNELPF